MEEKLLGYVSIAIALISITLCMTLALVPDIHGKAIEFELGREHTRLSIMELFSSQPVDKQEEQPIVIKDDMQKHEICLTLPVGATEQDIKIKSDYVNRLVTVNIKGAGKKYLENTPITGSCSNVEDIAYDTDKHGGVLDITTDRVYEPRVEFQDNLVYIDFVDPHEIYDYVVVIDAGHGGSVPGAAKQGVCEKDIDLDIVMEVKDLFDRTDKNVVVYYTRTTDVNPSFSSRVGLANDSDADLFLSVHNNSTASGRMSSINGTEVMYRAGDASGESKRLATMCLDNLVGTLGSKSKGTVVGDDIYIIRESKSPVALIEVGFMTNQAELDNLCDEAYQERCAEAIYNSVIQYLYGE